jgi:hypothetical protein
MKKILPGVLAVILAVTFSAFTTTGKKAKDKGQLIQYTFWYNAAAGKVGTIFYDGSSSGALAKDELDNPPCDDVSGPVCLVGSNSQLTQGNNIPSPATDNYMLRDN